MRHRLGLGGDGGSEEPRGEHRRHRGDALELEQGGLALEPARVAGQGPVLADDPVARDDDGQRVAPDRAADPARQPRIAQLAGQLAVGRGLAVGDLGDQAPDALLELVSVQGRREVEGGARSLEVLAELALRLGEVPRPSGRRTSPDRAGTSGPGSTRRRALRRGRRASARRPASRWWCGSLSCVGSLHRDLCVGRGRATGM